MVSTLGDVSRAVNELNYRPRGGVGYPGLNLVTFTPPPTPVKRNTHVGARVGPTGRHPRDIQSAAQTNRKRRQTHTDRIVDIIGSTSEPQTPRATFFYDF